jgi:ribosomal protein L40E
MAEILTESFCERCGTRYTFEASAPRKTRTGKIRLLSKGLRNYVLSDESTLEEALDEARGEEERQLSTQQLEAFHQTFNFCMSCRQYTCANCWNEIEARCLSCAPDLTHDVLPTAFPDLPIVPAFTALPGGSSEAPEAPPSAWPSSDLPADLAVVPEEQVPVTEEPEVPAAEAVDEPPDERLVARLAALGAIPASAAPPLRPEPTVEEDEAEIAALIAANEAAATEAEAAAAAAEQATTPRETGAPEPISAVPEPPTVDPAAAEPAAATSAPALPVQRPAEPVQLGLPDIAAVSPAPTQPAAPPQVPEVTEPPESLPAAATLAERSGWTMVAPEAPLVLEDRVAAAQPSGNGHHVPPPPVAAAPPPVAAAPPPAVPAPAVTAPPQWPEPAARPAPLAAGHGPRHGTDALWVASSRDVVSRPGSGVSACVSCGLPLSANARFCRRCGSRQAN